MDITTLDQFIELVYPAPKDNTNPDYNFYKQWGYEQFLIKKVGKEKWYNIQYLRMFVADLKNPIRKHLLTIYIPTLLLQCINSMNC